MSRKRELRKRGDVYSSDGPGPTCTVAVPTWLRRGWLAKCLASIDAQTRVPDEVLVVGRAEDHGSRQAFEQWSRSAVPNFRWITVVQEGRIPPIEAAVRASDNEILAFTDDDTELEADWLGRILEPFSDDRVACVGGQSIPPTGGFVGPVKPRSGVGRLTWYGRFNGHFGPLVTPRAVEVDAVLEGNSAWRLAVLRMLSVDPALREFDSLFYGLDLCQQAKARGYRIMYVHQARSVHHRAPRPTGDTERAREERAFVAGRHMTYVWLKHFHGVRRAAFPIWWFLIGQRQSYGLMKGIWDLIVQRGATWSVFRESLRGRADGIRVWRSRNRGAALAGGSTAP